MCSSSSSLCVKFFCRESHLPGHLNALCLLVVSGGELELESSLFLIEAFLLCTVVFVLLFAAVEVA